MLNSGTPAILFEDKVLYTESAHLNGSWDGLFRSRSVGPDTTWARVGLDEDAPPDWAIVAPGGMASRALTAMRRALLELELTCELLDSVLAVSGSVPSRRGGDASWSSRTV
ncbi:pyruvate dehydrogenase E1 component beta subunit [Micromonospora phaseoli]|uniref:Pyruvate dehydrogenase E1 component beta subunit n=1 Tax=Micromonospora phaseoli TaxID=1144548 RepID=A0A1H7DWL0_9ACTN|nr:hypothetical protein [Micromonospora phaseoli]PZV89987.1 hypothetical protein CLV64_11474 [Micromonospora phaseoli]GIJ78797.1 hypothetical protein Xph01_32290 [Micromonospora phaseoli]SEK04092.1 pyruvate dehydrogenase E1 component beta subunit [Micromonospora phaseoli]